jgi:hypothetical protein
VCDFLFQVIGIASGDTLQLCATSIDVKRIHWQFLSHLSDAYCKNPPEEPMDTETSITDMAEQSDTVEDMQQRYSNAISDLKTPKTPG